jgi:hypothetical protein
MVEIKVNRNVLYALLTLLGLVAALGIGVWLGRGPGSSSATPQGQPTAPVAAVPQSNAPGLVTVDPAGGSAPEILLGGTAQAVPQAINTPGFGELTPEQDAAVQRMELADAVAKIGDQSVVFVDTRTEGEFQTGRIKGAISMPAYTQDAMLETLPKDKEIILYCA